MWCGREVELPPPAVVYGVMETHLATMGWLYILRVFTAPDTHHPYCALAFLLPKHRSVSFLALEKIIVKLMWIQPFILTQSFNYGESVPWL